MAELYAPSGSGGLEVGGEYDPKITEELDEKIRNLPEIKKHCEEQAHKLRDHTGHPENFDVIVSSRAKTRARVYVAPNGSEGIRLELSQAVLLKAALALAVSHGKNAGGK